MSKPYSDARKELERIANQRKNFVRNSDLLRSNLVNTRYSQEPNTSNGHLPYSDQYMEATSRLSFSENLNVSTPMSGSQPSSNVYLQNENMRALTSSAFSPTPAASRRELERSLTLSYSPQILMSPHFQSVLSPVPGIGTASSVIGTFRQLQTRSRRVEQERTDAMKERDELRRQVEEHSQTLEQWRRQSEAQTTERFESMKAASDELLATRKDLELKMLSLQEQCRSTQTSNSADRAALLSLETERGDIRAIAHTIKSTVQALQGELSAASNRCTRIADQIITKSPTQPAMVEATIKSARTQIDSEERSKVLLEMRCEALQHYMQLVLKINGDLTHRIGGQEGLQNQLRDIEERFSPHKEAWSSEEKGGGNDNSADEGNKNNLEKKNLKLRPSSAPPRTRPNIPESRNGGYGSDRDGGNNNINKNNDKNYNNGSSSRGGLDPKSERDRARRSVVPGGAVGGVRNNEVGVRFSLDSAYRALSGDPNRRRSSSAHTRQHTQTHTRTQSDAHSTTSSQASSSRGTDKRATRGSGSGQVQVVRCKGSSALTSTSASRARANDALSGRYPIRSLSRSRSPLSRPPRSLSTGSTGGIGPAAGLVSDDGRERDTLYNQAVSAAAAALLNSRGDRDRGGFIPGGCTEGKEFNAYANSSKIARAAAHYNAAIAAREKAF